MRSIRARLDKLDGTDERERVFVWQEMGETTDLAITRTFGEAGPPANVVPVVISWMEE